MNESIINFYLLANKLKYVIRTGWKEVKISKERIESVAEHVYGCIILSIVTISEGKIDLDLLKIIKLIVIKELEKINLDKEYTLNGDKITDRKEKALATIKALVKGLIAEDELINLFEEAYDMTSKEAKFAFQIMKIESDFQAKIYDLNGEFSLEVAKEDAKGYGEELSKEIIPQMKNASDGWILFDRRYYEDEIFKNLSQDIQDMSI